jgi:hypothetical protein
MLAAKTEESQTWSLRRIKPTLAPGIATGDPPGAHTSPAHRPMFAHCQYEVLAATGFESANLGQEGADEDLITANACNKEEFQALAHPTDEMGDHRDPPSRASFRETRSRSEGSDCFKSASVGIC